MIRAQDPSIGSAPTEWNKDRTSFALPVLPPGNYRLEGVLRPPFYVMSALLNGRDMSREGIPISQTDADGAPRTALVVFLSGNSLSREVFADNLGHFKIAGFPAGDYRAYAWDDRNSAEYENPDWVKRFSPVPVSVQNGQTAMLKLTLLKAGL